MRVGGKSTMVYQRYHIDAKFAPNIVEHPHRFHVKINRWNLAKYLIKDFFHCKGNLNLFLSRPCVYGVFSGPLGGFMPREKLCVGCMRCATQHPDIATIVKNPARAAVGDSFFTADYVNSIVYEAETGRIPIRGAGYRGTFGGIGWDGMWTDMSEIVRPTRDGIHGREMISTAVDIGGRPPYLDLRESLPSAALTIPVPMLFDRPPPEVACEELCRILVLAAEKLNTFAILPVESLCRYKLSGSHLVPLVSRKEELDQISWKPAFIELEGWNPALYQATCERFKTIPIALRLAYDREAILQGYNNGARIFHAVADAHGRDSKGQFAMDAIREVHLALVKEGIRDEVTLLGSGGIIAAEHVAKSIICGLNAIALDTPLYIALQGRFKEGSIALPSPLPLAWGCQRLLNLMCSWRDQLLEILGAMGLREIRRLTGEMGRAMLQKELEREAFTGITGYE